MGEPWDQFQRRMRDSGEWSAYEVKAEEIKRLRDRLKMRGKLRFGVSVLAAVELGWDRDDREEVLVELADLRRRDMEGVKAAVKAVRAVQREVKAVSAGEWPASDKRRGRLPRSGAVGLEDVPGELRELARLVGEREAPLAECADWALSHSLVPLDQIRAEDVPGAMAVVCLVECFRPGGQSKLLQMRLSRAMSAEDGEWDRIRADVGEAVREELLAFVPGGVPESVSVASDVVSIVSSKERVADEREFEVGGEVAGVGSGSEGGHGVGDAAPGVVQCGAGGGDGEAGETA